MKYDKFILCRCCTLVLWQWPGPFTVTAEEFLILLQTLMKISFDLLLSSFYSVLNKVVITTDLGQRQTSA